MLILKSPKEFEVMMPGEKQTLRSTSLM